MSNQNFFISREVAQQILTGQLRSLKFGSEQYHQLTPYPSTDAPHIFLATKDNRQFVLNLAKATQEHADHNIQKTAVSVKPLAHAPLYGHNIVDQWLPGTLIHLAQQTWQIGEKLGEGAEACIYEIRRLNESKVFVMKVYKPNSLLSIDESIDDQTQAQMQSMARKEHGFLKAMGRTAMWDQNVVVMEKVPGMSYADLAQESSFLTLPSSVKLMVLNSIFSEVEAMHQRGIAHRDLDPTNIMIAFKVDNQPIEVAELLTLSKYDYTRLSCHAQIIDFGQATFNLAERNGSVGSRFNLANTLNVLQKNAKGYQPEAAVDDVSRALKFLFGTGTQTDQHFHQHNEFHSKFDGGHFKPLGLAILQQSQPDFYQDYQKFLTQYPELEQAFSEHYKTMLQRSIQSFVLRKKRPDQELKHLMHPFKVFVKALYAIHKIREQMNGQLGKAPIWLRVGKHEELKQVLNQLYEDPCNLAIIDRALGLCTEQQEQVPSVADDLQGFHGVIASLASACTACIHHQLPLDRDQIKHAAWAIVMLLAVDASLTIIFWKFAVLPAKMLLITNSITLPIFLMLLAVCVLLWRQSSSAQRLAANVGGAQVPANDLLQTCLLQVCQQPKRPLQDNTYADICGASGVPEVG